MGSKDRHSSPDGQFPHDGTITVDLRPFPPELHRLVLDWYRWQEAILRGIGRRPGGTVIPGATAEYSFWLASPPRMADDELVLDIGGLYWYLRPTDAGWEIQMRERNDRSNEAVFRLLSDAEKYLLTVLGSTAFTGGYTQTPNYRWHQKGLAHQVHLRPVDPTAQYSKQYVLLADEDVPRATMKALDAPSFSHALLMTYEQIDATYRAELPPGRFTLTVVAAESSHTESRRRNSRIGRIVRNTLRRS